jgi:hypothetical protein
MKNMRSIRKYHFSRHFIHATLIERVLALRLPHYSSSSLRNSRASPPVALGAGAFALRSLCDFESVYSLLARGG